MDNRKLSLLAAIGAYGVWGVFPLYWHALSAVPSLELMCHRVFWSFAIMLLLIVLSGQSAEAIAVAKQKCQILILACTGFCLGFNWLIYIWAVNNGHVLDASLGYYINPLLNVMFGILVFKDRPSRLQIAAISMALLGVLCQVIMLGKIPWIAFLLAITFALYAVLRKFVDVSSIIGLFWESCIMAPFVSAWLLYLWIYGKNSFGQGIYWQDAMLIGSSVVTTIPLIWFAFSAKHLSLITLGLIQYLTPTGAFLLGIFVFKEHFTAGHLLSFAFIWIAVAIYSFDGWRTYRQARHGAAMT